MYCLKKSHVAEASRCLGLWLAQCDLEESTGGTSLIQDKHQQVPPNVLQVKGRKEKVMQNEVKKRRTKCVSDRSSQ